MSTRKNKFGALTAKIHLILLLMPCWTFENVLALSRTFSKTGDINIGGFFPIHLHDKQSGNRSKLAYLSLAQAMIFAVEQINNDPEILPGMTLGYEVRDTCLKNRYAMEYAWDSVKKYQQFEVTSAKPLTCSLREKPNPLSAIIGTGRSQSSLEVTNLLQLVDLPLISYAATSDELSSKQYFAFFRTVPPDALQSRAMVDIVLHFNWRYVTVLGSDDTYGRKGIEEFIKRGKSKGICVALEEYFPMQPRESKLQAMVRRVKQASKAQVIVLYCTSSQAQSIIEEALRQGLTGRTWIASEGWGGSAKFLDKKYSAVIKGAIGVVLKDVKVKKYEEYIKSLTPARTPAPWWSEFWENSFNCSFDGKTAGRSMCSNLKVTEQLYTEVFSDRLNAYVMDAVFAVALALHNMSTCTVPFGLLPGGQCPIFRHNIPKSSDLLLYLRNTTFHGQTGTIDFDRNGDSTNAGYQIVNLQEDSKGSMLHKVVGRWYVPDDNDTFQLEINKDLMQWNTEDNARPESVCSKTCPPGTWQTSPMGCCWECIPCSQGWISAKWGSRNCTKCADMHMTDLSHTVCIHIPVVYVKMSDSAAIILTTLTSLGIVCAIFTLSTFIKYQNTPVVKGSNKDLSYSLLICIILCYLSVYLYLHKPSVLFCSLQPLIFYVCYTTAIAILFVKTIVMVKAFNARSTHIRRKRTFLDRNTHRIFVVCLGSVQLLIVGFWLVLDHPRPHYDRHPRTIFLECKPFVSSVGLVLRYLAIAYLCLLSLLCTCFAYKARKLPENFNEAKYIAFTMYVMLITWITFYPVQANVTGTHTIIISCSTNILASSSILLCIFSHKIYIIYFQPEKNTVQFVKATITEHTFRKASVSETNRVTLSATPPSTPTISRIRALSSPAPQAKNSPPKSKRSESAPVWNKFLGRCGSLKMNQTYEVNRPMKVVSIAMLTAQNNGEGVYSSSA